MINFFKLFSLVVTRGHSWSLMVTRVLLDMIISFRVSFIHYVIILRVSYSIPHLEEFLKWLLFILIVLWKIFLRNYLKQGTYIINVGMHIILVSTARSRFRCRSLRHSLGNTCTIQCILMNSPIFFSVYHYGFCDINLTTYHSNFELYIVFT